jgi:hypothetical protein
VRECLDQARDLRLELVKTVFGAFTRHFQYMR